MTPEQRDEMIGTAAKAFADALTRANCPGIQFDVEVGLVEVTTMGDAGRRFAYVVNVRETSARQVC